MESKQPPSELDEVKAEIRKFKKRLDDVEASLRAENKNIKDHEIAKGMHMLECLVLLFVFSCLDDAVKRLDNRLTLLYDLQKQLQEKENILLKQSLASSSTQPPQPGMYTHVGIRYR